MAEVIFWFSEEESVCASAKNAVAVFASMDRYYAKAMRRAIDVVMANQPFEHLFITTKSIPSERTPKYCLLRRRASNGGFDIWLENSFEVSCMS